MTRRPSTLLDLVTDGLAAYRLTRLLVTDDIIATTRDEIVRTAYIRAGRAETVYDEIRADRAECEQSASRRAFAGGTNEDDAAKAADVKDACSDIIDLAERGGWSEYARGDIAPPAVAQLVTCSWCMGVHVGLIIETVRALSRRRRPDPLRALALAAAAALIAGLERS